MSANPKELPEDLASLLRALRCAGPDPGHRQLIELRTRIQMMSSHQLPPGDALRLVMDSEDLAQDSLLALVQGSHAFRGTTWAEFIAFARALIERQKVDLRRHYGRSKRHMDAESAEAAEDHVIQSESPSFIAAGKEERHRLLELLEGLPELQRRALRLRLRSLDYDAIAAELEMSRDNARQTVSRAIRRLRELW